MIYGSRQQSRKEIGNGYPAGTRRQIAADTSAGVRTAIGAVINRVNGCPIVRINGELKHGIRDGNVRSPRL
jgi:hypothetical protein